MPFPLRFPTLDPDKVAAALTRQLRYHGILEAFIEICEAGLDAFGMETKQMQYMPPRSPFWGLNGSPPLIQLVPDSHPIRRAWTEGRLRGALGRFLKAGDRLVLTFLRSRRYGGPYIRAVPVGQSPMALIAACAAMLHGSAQSVAVYEDSVMTLSLRGSLRSVEVGPDVVRYGLLELTGTGQIQWDMLLQGRPDHRVPAALLQVTSEVLFVQDEMIDTLLGLYFLAVCEQREWPRRPASLPQVLTLLGETLKACSAACSPWDVPAGGVTPQPYHPSRPLRKMFNTSLMAGSRSLLDILSVDRYKSRAPGILLQVNLLELFNFYVVDHSMLDPKGFWAMTRRLPIVDEKPRVEQIRLTTLRRWHSFLHDC